MTTFRLVIQTQIYENYGAHNWDGEGECPQYWKAKGGRELHHQVGNTAAVMALGSKGTEALFESLRGRYEQSDEYYQEYVISWGLFSSDEETPSERMYRELHEAGYMSDEEYELDMSRLQAPSMAVAA